MPKFNIKDMLLGGHQWPKSAMGSRLRFVLVLVLILTTGCSTASWVINPPPHVSDLYVTEDDVVEYMDRLSEQAGDPDAVYYNPETDRYELRSDVYKKALTQSIMYQIQKEKIGEFSEDYERETFGGALKKDLTTFVIGYIMGIVSVFAGGL